MNPLALGFVKDSIEELLSILRDIRDDNRRIADAVEVLAAVPVGEAATPALADQDEVPDAEPLDLGGLRLD